MIDKEQIRLIQRQYPDEELYNRFMGFKNATPELANVLLQHVKFLQDKNLVKSDVAYTMDYLIQVRKFVATLAKFIESKNSYFRDLIRNSDLRRDPHLSSHADGIIAHGLTDSRHIHAVHVKDYMRDALTYLSKVWFKMELDDFITKYAVSYQDKFSTATNKITEKENPHSSDSDAKITKECIDVFTKVLADNPNRINFELRFTKAELEFLIRILNQHQDQSNHNLQQMIQESAAQNSGNG